MRYKGQLCSSADLYFYILDNSGHKLSTYSAKITLYALEANSVEAPA